MSFAINCYTLFDITKTGITPRHKSTESDNDSITLLRNKQHNFDTILQLVSLRSQPEDITDPVKCKINFNYFDRFGFLFQEYSEDVDCWVFSFSVQHRNVFNDGISDMGHLYNDCHNVPMIKIGTEWNRLPNFLDTTEELRNIYFEVKTND